MVKVRQVHRLPSHAAITFDDQLWPINVALLVLGGFVAGAIIALSDFESPNPFANGWVRLVSLAASMGLLMWGATLLDNRHVRRGLQLAALLSLIFHSFLMFLLYNQHLAVAAQNEESAEMSVEFDADTTLPDYNQQEADDAPPQEHERPVEVVTPDSDVQQVAREVPPSQDMPRDSQPTPVPGTTPEVAPSNLPLERSEQAVPRQSEESSLLSRQMTKSNPEPQQVVAAPEMEDRSAADSSQTDPRATPVERQANQAAAPRDLASPEPEAPREQQAVQLTRHEAPQPDLHASSVAMLDRKLNEPAQVPRSEAEAPQALPSSDRPAAEAQPNVVVSRQETNGPQAAMQQSPEVKPAAAVEVGRLDTARPEAAQNPQIATNPQPSPARTSDAAIAPSSVAAEAPQAETNAPANAPSVSPAATQVARGEVQAPTGQVVGVPGAETAAPRSSAVAAPSVGRVEVSVQPSLDPQAAASGQVARAARSANVEAAPASVDSPAMAESAGGNQPQSQPARTALSKGVAGIAGIGQEQNFDRGLTATQQPAPVASASASRPAAVQRGPAGPALTPSAPATVAKSLAGADVPSATLPINDVGTADAVGAARPSQIEATSSAAVQRADSSAPAGAITAGAGNAQVDIGPTQVVANSGTGRAAGGGGATVKLNTQGPQLARSDRGGAPVAGLSAQAVAAAPEAPAGTGGGAPAAGALTDNRATTVTRSAGGGGLPTGAAGPIGAAPSGAAAGPVASGEISRAAGGNQSVSGPILAGGTIGPARSVGRTFAADTKADVPQLPGGPAASEQRPASAPGAPSGTGTTRVAAGLPGRATSGPVGALGGPISVDSPLAGSPGLGSQPTKGGNGADNGPVVSSLATGGALRKANVAGVAGGTGTAAIDAPEAGASAGTATAQPQPQAVPAGGAGQVGLPARRTGSLPVQVAAIDGPGGLGSQRTPEVGSLSRKSQRDSEVVHAGTARFIGRKAGGPLAIDGKAREPAEAFATRGGQRLTKGGGTNRPPERTEESVEAGLDFLARHQSADGSWSLNHFGAGKPGYEQEKAIFQSDTAATGMALLAFFGAGYDHYDDKYQRVVRSGLEFLVSHQKPDGDLYLPLDRKSNESAQFYSHGIASIALCEGYGMTGDEDLRESAQKAINFIVTSQHPQLGGWRYAPQFSADTSVSGWQLMALKSGELAGLKIPPETYDRVRKWLDRAQASDGSQYAYNPLAKRQDQAAGKRPTKTMTAVGLLMRQYTGWNRQDPRMIKGAESLLESLPAIGTQAQPERDTYYWYYATQVMFHMKGDFWQKWNERLHPLLVERQLKDGPFAGSWDPLGPIPDRWGPQGGRIYVTALNLLSLEVYYRHLPIYESEAK